MWMVLRRVTVAATACAMGLVTVAQAATVNVYSGRLLINQGRGYINVPGAIQAKPGDMVIAVDGGSGQITYDDGCHQIVEVGSVTAIGQISPCAAAGNPLMDYSLITGTIVVGAGVALGIGLTSKDDRPVSK